jgi:hypothetical protein
VGISIALFVDRKGRHNNNQFGKMWIDHVLCTARLPDGLYHGILSADVVEEEQPLSIDGEEFQSMSTR